MRFGRWSVLGYLGAQKWLCVCDCGNYKTVKSICLRNSKSKSCGCWFAECRTTHNLTKSPEYQNWSAIKSRCLNKKHMNYQKYGGRNIIICDRWVNSFENFLSDMGERPSPSHSIDRIDNDGNYEPENCRWATPKEQGSNRRNNRIIEYNGESLPLCEWEDRSGLPRGVIKGRLRIGWNMGKAISTPLMKSKFKGRLYKK